MTNPTTPSRAAVYAQLRRDNEIEARELLRNQLKENGIRINATLEGRGDLNFTTKVLVTALLHFDPNAPIPTSFDRKACSTNSAEYNQLRRTNERDVCESLRKKIPEHILKQDFMHLSNLNPTTKIVVATARYLDAFEVASPEQEPVSSSPMVSSMLIPEEDPDVKMHLPSCLAPAPRFLSTAVQPPTSARTSDFSDFPALTRQTTIPDSDDEDIPILLAPPPRGTFTNIDSDSKKAPEKRAFDQTVVLHNPQNGYDLGPAPVQPMTAKKKRSKSPEKNNDTTRPWEKHESQVPWEQQVVERHPVEEVQQLEQVAKRLVAKAKEMIEPSEETNKRGYAVQSEDVTDGQLRDIEMISDLIIDAVTVVESREERRRKMKKWAAEQAKWAKEHMLQ